MGKIVAWWSGGLTSAVACKYAVAKYNAELVFIETGSHHPDTQRFKKDCEKWYGKEILQLQNQKFTDHFDVVEKVRYVNGPGGARCTGVLKRQVRERWEKTQQIKGYVWGFEDDKKERNRAERLKVTTPNYTHIFPLIEKGLSKKDCISIVTSAGIDIPEMYKLGFTNNNCIGCVKGGMAYWNKIREHFPDHFNKMAKLERDIGRSCIRKYFLDELPPDAGRGQPPLVTECGSSGEGCTTTTSRDYYQERAELEVE